MLAAEKIKKRPNSIQQKASNETSLYLPLYLQGMEESSKISLRFLSVNTIMLAFSGVKLLIVVC